MILSQLIFYHLLLTCVLDTNTTVSSKGAISYHDDESLRQLLTVVAMQKMCLIVGLDDRCSMCDMVS